MKKYSYKILVLALASCVAIATPTHATVKLEATGPAADIAAKIQKVKEKYEDIQSKILKEKEKWTKKAEAFMNKTLGTEGAALFHQFVVKPGAGIVESAAKGQFNAGDFSLSGFTDAMKSELGNYKLDYATLAAQSRDMIESDAKAKREKEKALDVQIAQLRAEWEMKRKLYEQTKDITLAGEIVGLAQRIANLEQQKTEVTSDMTAFNQEDKISKQMNDLQAVMADYSSKINQEDILKQLNSEALSMFTLKMEEEETEAVYAASVEKLFLGKYEFGNSENLARVRKARKEEFFKSEKNLVNVIVDTYKSIQETGDKMKKCEQARDNAQAIFGQESMRVCLDIQIVKVAAQYMEMLLAQIRHESSAEIQKWADVYKLPDYSRDYTKFNLDDYVLTKDDLKRKMKDKISGAVGNAMMNFKGF
ncbi:MAG: hypothetical protein II830_01785 [Alphaproteobacteria bacterium]|nr:hypothetical protein [Alphaproteobacteria bacterium]